ncbi:UNVERIFIED_CONTAM: hypothetical protein Sradi_4327300 [Sesamum radiatum]|uniref:Uncharacterized protein n=1 Tax=Sesamum radiatum TaxID=300843 RepID=A0AAW2NNA2_SESRA
MADSSGTTLMDLITSDGSSSKPPPASSATAPPPMDSSVNMEAPGAPMPMVVERKSKRGTLMQIQSDTISAAKAAFHPVRANIMPQRQKKRYFWPVSYAQLARSIHELAATSDQKSSQRQLVHHVFPKLAVYNSVDPSLAPSLLMLDQQCEDRTVLRYVYYYLARILSDSGSQGLSPGGGIPTPNWDALADIDAGGGVTRADVVPRVVERLTSEALNEEVEYGPRSLWWDDGPLVGLIFCERVKGAEGEQGNNKIFNESVVLWSRNAMEVGYWKFQGDYVVVGGRRSIVLAKPCIRLVIWCLGERWTLDRVAGWLPPGESGTGNWHHIEQSKLQVHARRLQALKALTYAPSSNSEILSRLYEIVFSILDKFLIFLTADYDNLFDHA